MLTKFFNKSKDHNSVYVCRNHLAAEYKLKISLFSFKIWKKNVYTKKCDLIKYFVS